MDGVGEGGGEHRKPWSSVAEFFFSGRQTYGQDSRYDKTSKPEAGVTPGFA